MKTRYWFLKEGFEETSINKYFGFLVNDYGFIKIPQYSYVREIHSDFIKDNIIIKLVYDGTYWLEILKSKEIEAELLNYKKTTIDFENSNFKRYNITKLDPSKKIYNSVSSNNFQNKDLWYFSKLIKDNPEILNGDFSKFNWKYRLLKKIGLIKNK